MNVIFAMVADDAHITEAGKLDIIGVFGTIFASAFPARHPKMSLVMRFEVPSVEFGHKKSLRVPVVGPGGMEIAVLEGEFEVGIQPGYNGPKPPSAMHDQIVEFPDLIFPSAGSYALHIVVQGETKTTVPLELVKLETLKP